MISEPVRLDLRVQDADGAKLITVRGDLDLASANAVRETLLKLLAEGPVVLELGGLEFCDSAGLRTLVEADRAARSQGRALLLCALPSAVERVLELAGARAVFSIFPDARSALGGLSG